MLHPLFSIIVRRPDLLVEHVSGYAALAHEEASEAMAELLKRLAAGALAVVFGVAFVTLAGMALMLGILLDRFHWILLACPLLMLVLLALAVSQAKKPLATQRFAELKAQVHRDAQALRTAA